ncbi:hypothetical protein P4B35_09650 [Pontiellaceae bacterium B12227]|nr:hypothetical protein [Pontiellaceae bacterium B12227]
MKRSIVLGILCAVANAWAVPEPVLKVNVDLVKWFEAAESTNQVAAALALMGASTAGVGVYVDDGAIIPVARLNTSLPQAAALFLSNTNASGLTVVSPAEFKWMPGKKAEAATDLFEMGDPMIRISGNTILAGPESKLDFAGLLDVAVVDADIVNATVDLKPLVDPFLSAAKRFVDEQAEGMAKGIMGSMYSTLEKTLRGSGELPLLSVRIAEAPSKDRQMTLGLQFSAPAVAEENKVFFDDASNAWKNPKMSKQQLGMCQLAESPFFQTLELDGDRVLFTYAWNPTNDAAMLESIGQPITSSLFSFSDGSSFPIKETETIHAPDFQSLETFDAAAFEKDFRSALFFDHAWQASVSLVLDWLDMPCQDLINITVSNICVLTEEGEDIAVKNRAARFHIDSKRKSGRLQLSIEKDKPSPATASFEVFFEVPGKIGNYELSAANPLVELNGGGLCLVNLSNSVAHVRSKNMSLSDAKMYGIDADGNYLARSGASWSKSSSRVEYKGRPKKVVVAFPEDPESFSIRFSDFPVSKESKLKIPQDATNNVPTRFSFEPVDTFRSPDLEAVAAGTMSYVTNGGWRKNECCLLFPMPEEVKVQNLALKSWLAGSDKLAFQGQGSGWSGAGGNFKWELKDTNSLNAASAIFGEVELKMRAGVDAYEIDLLTNAVPFTQNDLPTIRSEHNVVWIRKAGNDAEVLSLLAYDPDDRQLKDGGRKLFRNSEQGFCFWGMPASARVVYAASTETVTVPFEIELKAGGLADVSKARKNAEAFDQLVDEFKEIGEKSRSFRNLLAANYYQVNYRGEPEARVSLEVANADPVCAELFGYELKPYKGYYMKYVPSDRDVGKEHKTRSCKWSGGEFEAPSYHGLLLAVSAEKKQPSVLFRWNEVYVNYADCSGIEQISTDQSQLEKAGWIKIR